MFVFSVNSKKLCRTLLPALALIAGIAVTFIVFGSKEEVETEGSALSYRAADKEERLYFVSQFGWAVNEEPAEVREIVIPDEFDAVYENYNKIQKEQGLDLEPFKGKRVKRWTYIITNYPGYSEGDDCVRINLLVFDGRVVGGDVCSVELDGFMHTFAKKDG